MIDGSATTYSDIPYAEKGQGVALAGVKIDVIANSYKFDLKTREMIMPKPVRLKAKTAGLRENGKTEKK